MRLIDLDEALRACEKPSIYDLTDVPDFLAEFPVMDVEPVRHGRWEDSRGWGGCYVACSECGSLFLDNHYAWDYCPACGAKMDEDD